MTKLHAKDKTIIEPGLWKTGYAIRTRKGFVEKGPIMEGEVKIFTLTNDLRKAHVFMTQAEVLATKKTVHKAMKPVAKIVLIDPKTGNRRTFGTLVQEKEETA